VSGPLGKTSVSFEGNCLKNRGNDDLGMLVEHLPRKAQHPPAIRDQSVLSPSVRLEEIVIFLVQPAINLDCEFYMWERDVDVIAAALEKHGKVGLPTGEPCRPKNPVGEALGGRPGFVSRVDEQP
jgi:hypothetical protein